jgi:acyl-CoA thioester hydrolase
VYGFEQSLDQSGRRRLRHQTPIRDLYLVGAWTWAGGGYEGAVMSGVQTSAAVRRRLAAEKPSMTTPSPKPIRDEAPAGFPFVHTLRVYLEDTDAVGIAFHGAYVRFLERGRTEAFVPVLQAELGIADWRERYLFNVYRIDIVYLKPSRLGDLLEVRTRFEPVSKFRLVATQEIHLPASQQLLVKARTEVIVIDRDGRLLPLPPELLDLPNIGRPA